MTANGEFEDINDAKVNLEHIYDEPDPRAYFRELRKLRYEIPGSAKPIFKKIISYLSRSQRGTVRVLDLGCSYGVNGALLKHDLSMSDLYDRWGKKKFSDVPSEDVVNRDRKFFAELELADDIEVIGLDPATNAVEYAEEVGLVDQGMTVNLEAEPLPNAMQEELSSVDMVMSTGCVGYVTEQTFSRLLPSLTRNRPAWIANFVLRMFPFAPIEEVLSRRGYVTEKLSNEIFIQRMFATCMEKEQVLDKLDERGIDSRGMEEEGKLLAEFYLSRPEWDAEELPLARLLAA